MIIVGSITGINQELSRGTLLFNVSNNMLWIAFVICYLLIFFSRVVVKDHNRVWKCRKCHFQQIIKFNILLIMAEWDDTHTHADTFISFLSISFNPILLLSLLSLHLLLLRVIYFPLFLSSHLPSFLSIRFTSSVMTILIPSLYLTLLNSIRR